MAKTLAQSGAAHMARGGCWVSISIIASASADEEVNHCPQGLSSLLSMCTCQAVPS